MYTDAHGSIWRREFQVKFLGHAAFFWFPRSLWERAERDAVIAQQ